MAASFFAVELPTSKREEQRKKSRGTLNKYDFLSCMFRFNRTVYFSVGGSVCPKFTCSRLFVWLLQQQCGGHRFHNEEMEMVLRYCQCQSAISTATQLIVTRATMGQMQQSARRLCRKVIIIERNR